MGEAYRLHSGAGAGLVPGMPATGLVRRPTTGPTTRSDRRVGLCWRGLEGQGELLAGQPVGDIPRP
jgi:hypothetical protein